MRIRVTYKVRYETYIECETKDDIQDEISDIDIPVDEDSSYIEDSFEVCSTDELE